MTRHTLPWAPGSLVHLALSYALHALPVVAPHRKPKTRTTTMLSHDNMTHSRQRDLFDGNAATLDTPDVHHSRYHGEPVPHQTDTGDTRDKNMTHLTSTIALQNMRVSFFFYYL